MTTTTLEPRMAKSKQTPTPADDRAGQKDYGLDRKTFVTIWESAATATEAWEDMARHSEEQGLPVMPKPIMFARAASYRKQGIDLQRHRSGRPASGESSPDEMNAIIADIRKKKARGQPTPAPAAGSQQFALPPEVEDEIIAKVVQRLLAQLGKSK
jgi:hypothetical protein